MLQHRQQLQSLNASGRAPRQWTRDHFSRYDKMPTHGRDTVTVPDAVPSRRALSERFGALHFRRRTNDLQI